LTAAGNPHIAIAPLTLSDHPCHVRPGTNIFFVADVGLEMRGASASLFIEGTADSAVALTGWQGAMWLGVSDGPSPVLSLEASHVSISLAKSAITLDQLAAGSDVHLSALTITGGTNLVAIQIFRPGDGTAISLSNLSLDHSGGVHVETTSEALVQYCEVSGGGNAFLLGGNVLADHLIARSASVGIAAYSYGGHSPSIADCVSTSNYDCLLYGNAGYDAVAEVEITAVQSLNAQNNYWGSTTTAEMTAEGTFADIEAIYDFWDDSNWSLVDYSGFMVTAVERRSWASIKASYR
jgi:hypothetical protein